MIEYAVIGAGVTGSFTAYYLAQKGHNVVLFDSHGVASGGSGAAGAFIAPKIGKSGKLQSLIDTAYSFSTTLYTTQFRSLYTQKGLLHSKENEKHFIKDAGIIDPNELCNKLTKDVKVFIEEVNTLKYEDDLWYVNDKKAKNVVLAMGAANSLLNEPYIDIRPIWGERIEVISDTVVPYNLHENISISATKKNGRIVIGATHLQNMSQSELHKTHKEQLLTQSKQLFDLGDVRVVDHRGGARAGTVDYIPIIGSVVNSKKTIQAFPQMLNGRKVPFEKYVYYPNLSIINGVGGRGFVLSPYLAYTLVKSLIEGTEIDDTLACARLFSRWVKRQK